MSKKKPSKAEELELLLELEKMKTHYISSNLDALEKVIVKTDLKSFASDKERNLERSLIIQFVIELSRQIYNAKKL